MMILLRILNPILYDLWRLNEVEFFHKYMSIEKQCISTHNIHNTTKNARTTNQKFVDIKDSIFKE